MHPGTCWSAFFAFGERAILNAAQQKLDAESQKITGTLAGEAKQDVDQKLSENRTAEFLSLMQEGAPFGGTFPSNANQAAASRARQDMTDHFKSLSPQDQTTWISLIKKYRTGRLTEDELKTLNDLNPDFVPELPMPKSDGLAINANNGDKNT